MRLICIDIDNLQHTLDATTANGTITVERKGSSELLPFNAKIQVHKLGTTVLQDKVHPLRLVGAESGYEMTEFECVDAAIAGGVHSNAKRLLREAIMDQLVRVRRAVDEVLIYTPR